ncbi:MAG: hypothetical protein NTV34_00920 [Proteobacteria bacterium]|nr:hypothetical protein [Pseudomonadota bacterium]
MTDTITTLTAIGIDLGDKDAHYACLNEEGKFTEEGTGLWDVLICTLKNSQ